MVEGSIEEPEKRPLRLSGQTILAIEALVVLLYAYCPSFFSEFTTSLGHSASLFDPIRRLVNEVAYVGPILLIVWVAERSLRSLGFTRPVWKWDVPLAIGLTACMFLSHWAARTTVAHVFWPLQRSSSSTLGSVRANVSVWIILPGTLASVVFQETLMRGYIVGRLRGLMGSAWMPVVTSSILFGLWHLYEGPTGTAGAFIDGILFAIVFARTQRLWPMLAAHFAYNSYLAFQTAQHLHR